MHEILVVDDEQDVIELLQKSLSRSGKYSVISAADGVEAIAAARRKAPSLIVLDLMLPKLSGVEVCKLLRTDPVTREIPIIMLTARADEIDRIVGLELGADDYVTKPFSPRELALRIDAILRRRDTGTSASKALKAGVVKLDPDRHEVTVGSRVVQLTAVEFKLLKLLLQRRGRVQGRDRLLNEVWGYEAAIDTRTVDTHVRRLREKLGTSGDIIETVRGFGYRLREGV